MPLILLHKLALHDHCVQNGSRFHPDFCPGNFDISFPKGQKLTNSGWSRVEM